MYSMLCGHVTVGRGLLASKCAVVPAQWGERRPVYVNSRPGWGWRVLPQAVMEAVEAPDACGPFAFCHLGWPVEGMLCVCRVCVCDIVCFGRQTILALGVGGATFQAFNRVAGARGGVGQDS